MFKQIQQLRKEIANFIAPDKNSMTLPEQFMRYGNMSRMNSDWTDVTMNDEDMYTGYGYAAIRNRANSVARIAIEHATTRSNQEDLVHPYLSLIESSPTFSDYAFWNNISTFIDLEGVYYLMVLRNFDENRTGNPIEFKMLNPYNIRRIINPETLAVEGYTESRNGYLRDIPAKMIIEIRELNPFSVEHPFSITDAAKENQFTLKTASDYTRNALRNDINAPGIMGTDVILPQPQFRDFIARVKNHTKGEPLFANGSAVKWESMSTDVSKASLDKVNEVQRDMLLAVLGVGKTMVGIEQSGTTRETARVQKDLFIENQVLPRIQLIIDALNQDYENNYRDEFNRSRASIIVDNPTTTDHEGELKEAEANTKKFDLFQSLVTKGYDTELAADYVEGKITLEQLGEPTNEVITPPIEPVVPAEQSFKKEENEITVAEEQQKGLVDQQQGFLKNAIVNVEEQIVMSVINRVNRKTSKTANQFEDEFTQETDIISKAEEKDAINELILVLMAFYGVVMNLQGGESMRSRTGEFALPGDFTLNSEIQKSIKNLSKKVAESHVSTIVNDLFTTVKEMALAGKSQQDIINAIKDKYSSVIVESRAKAVARTETNRAFTNAQYEADKQFIRQNGLNERAYKRLRVRSSNPCAFCSSIASQGLIPFSQNFRSLGDDIEVDGKVLKVNFESITAGNLHTNCSCDYELVIESEASHTKRLNELKEEEERKLTKVKNDIQQFVDGLEDIL